MKKYNIKKLISSATVVNCKTKKQAKNFFKYLRKLGYTWKDGDTLWIKNTYNVNQEKTCYELTKYDTVIYDSLECFKEYDYKIIPLKDIKIKKEKKR